MSLWVFNQVVCGILQLFVCTLGIIGNTISAIVLTRPEMRSSFTVLLMGLALADNTYLVTKLLWNVFPYSLQFFDTNSNYETFYLPLLFPSAIFFGYIGLTASTYFTVAITLERFVVIYWPLQGRKICTVKTAWNASSIITVLSFFYSLPVYFERHVQYYTEISEENVNMTTTVYVLEFTEFGLSDFYQVIFLKWCYPIFNVLIPFVLLTVFNTAIYVMIIKANHQRQNMTESQNVEISIAKTLICVVVVFGVCHLPNSVFYSIVAIMNPYVTKFFCAGTLALSVNSSVNFIIYYLMSQKFRSTLIRLCRKALWWHERPGANRDGEMTRAVTCRTCTSSA